MMKVRKTRIIIILLFLCLTNVVLGQIQTVRDTIFCFSKDVIIEYPLFNKITVDNYEEGFFRIINCPLDSAGIVIHCGAMMNLPLMDTTNATISSSVKMGKDLCSTKGYYIQDGIKKYFREDNYFKYHFTILYMNVGEAKLEHYEYFLNNIKIRPRGMLVKDYK